MHVGVVVNFLGCIVYLIKCRPDTEFVLSEGE